MTDSTKQDDAVAQIPAEPGASLPTPAAAIDTTDHDKAVDKATTDLTKKQNAVDKAQAALDDSLKSPEQLALEKAKQDADDAKAKHADVTAVAADAVAQPMTVAGAKVLAVVDPTLSAGDFRAQKFGNDPANPQLAPGVDLNGPMVKLSRKTPDIVNGLAYTEVPKEMVGDYERAGWNRM